MELEPQEPAHLRVLALAQGPQGPAPLQVKEPAQKPGHLRVRERLRVRLMESPQLGEQLESRPEAVLSPHLHPQRPREPAHLQDQEPVRVKWEVIWEPEPLVLQAQVPQFPPAEPLGQEAQGRLPAVREVLAVLEVVPRSC